MFKSALAIAAIFTATASNAAVVYSYGAVPAGNYTAPTFSDGVKASVQSTSVYATYLQPKGTTGDYLVVSSMNGSAGSATINTHGATSYSFVWGSPDSYNILDIFTNDGMEEITGSTIGSLFGFSANGDNANTGLFTITGLKETTIDHLVLKSTGVAFEVATAVPEPETYALMLAGLGVIGFVARRRKS